MTPTDSLAAGRRTRTKIQTAAAAVGAIFLLLGVLGFIPGITNQYDQMSFAGHDFQAQLLNVFQVSALHNIVHLVFGVLGLITLRTITGAQNYLIYGGVVYVVLWLYGLIINHDSVANFVPTNRADDWLHLILGVGMIALAVLLSRDSFKAHGMD